MRPYKTILAAVAAIILAACTQQGGGDTPVYLDRNADLEARIDDALSRMTLEEKVKILHAQSKFSSAGVPRLGIPELWCTDGPHGVRAEVLWDEWDTAGWTNDSIVAFPALTCLSATWNSEMSALYGKSVGEEARYREKDVLLGPGVNIYRSPLNGRNFEYMGEDPHLSATMVVPYVQNVQKNGVAVCVKHFALNNEETFRHTTDIDITDRALYEIYLPAFKAAVQQGGAWSVMSSYNLFRGRHVSQDTILTKRILKDEWSFDGAVISDWGAVHDTDEAIESGLDIEFGSWTDGLTMGRTNAYDAYYLADAYLKRLRDGRADEADLDAKARRVLRLIMRTAMREDKPFGSICSEEHYAAARKIAGEGIVLLKNDGGVLPAKDVRNILVVGENAVKPLTVGGGSSSLKVQREVSPLEGIRERAGDINVAYARGYVGSPGTSQDGLQTVTLDDPRSPEELIAEACRMASEADLVIFVGGLNKDGNQDCEGTDRLSLGLPYGQDGLIEALAAANSRLAVVLVSGNAVAMPWLEQVPSVLQGWYLGSEAGHALADVIFGDVNPSGKLPFTFPARLEDSPAHFNGKAYPTDGANFYDEGIYVGYRWFEAKDIKPLFAFGHGLSYTTFEYGDARLGRSSIKRGGSVEVSVPVTNTGAVAGAEVVQLYVSDSECSIDRPVKELKAFTKVFLAPGETQTVRLTISEEDLKFFDEVSHSWKAEPGEFDILIGSASDDIRTSVKFTL